MHPSGRWIAVAGIGVTIVKIGSGIVRNSHNDAQYISVAFSNDGTTLLAADRDGLTDISHTSSSLIHFPCRVAAEAPKCYQR